MGKTTEGKNRNTTEYLESLISEWRTVFDSITDLVSVLDSDYRIIRVNRPFAKYLGVEPQDLIGKKCHQVMHGTDKPVSYCPIAKSIHIKKPVHKEVYDSRLNKHFMISLSPILDVDGNVQSIVHIMRDITARKKTEAKLRESEEKYRKLIETSNDAIFLADTESGIIFDANKRSEELLGMPLNKIIGMHQTELHPKEERENYREIFQKHVKESNAFISDLLVVHKSGRKIPVDISASMIEIGGKAVLQGVFRDITERKKAEEELKLFQSLINQSNDAIFVIDTDTSRFLNVNDKACSNLGYIRDELLEMGVIDIEAIVPDNFSWKEHMQEVRRQGYMLLEGNHKRKDGTTYPAEVNAKLVYINDKEYMVSVVRDITDRKKAEEELSKYHNELEIRVQERTLEIERANEELLKQINDRKEAEEALRESEERFRVAATAMSDLLWEGDVRKNSLNWYGDIDRHLGYEEGEFPRTISGHVENIHKDDRELFIKSVDRALETGNDFRAEYRIRCKDGTYRYWDETGKAIEYEDGKAVRWIGSVTDISDRKIVEEQIMQSEEQFKKLSQEFNALLDAIPDNIVLLDSDLKILWANKASSQKFNKENNMLEGEHCYEMCCNIVSPCEDCPALISFKSGKEETARRIGPSGTVWDIRTFPITDEKGKVKNVIEVARDVSTRIKLEKEANALQAKLIHANKMTSLGTLVSGVAHEINNPNSFIMTNADLFGDIWKDAFKLLNKLDDEYKHAQVGGVSFSDLGMVVP